VLINNLKKKNIHLQKKYYMKTKLFTILFLVVGVLFSCKKEEKKVEENSTITSTVKNVLVQMDIIQTTASNYAVYYTEDNTVNFTDDYVIWNEVKPSPNEQTLDFNFPESAYPTHIRFDFGNAPQTEDVVLKKFKISYGDKSLEVKGADFFKFFQKNDSIITEIDETNGSIKFLKGTADTKISPFFYPNEILVVEIAKIMNQ
jgi:hypothetical protein